MSDQAVPSSETGGIAKAMLRAVVAVIYSGIVMQLVGVVMLAIPGLAFDTSSPPILTPAFFVAAVIIGVGIGITLAGCKPVVKLAKKLGGVVGSAQEKTRGMSSPMAAAPAARAVAAGATIIRPPLIKRETSEVTAPTPAQKTQLEPKPRQAPVEPPKKPDVSPMLAPELPIGNGPADLDAVRAAVNQIAERYSKPDVRSKFEGWVNNLVIDFPDINKSYLYKINGAEGIDMTEGSDETAAVQVTMASDMFVKLLSKQINAIKAYSSGALKVKGEMKNLLKLRKLMF